MTRQKNSLFSGVAAAAVIILSVSACTSVKKELGVDRNSPDEFMVVKNTPLTLPPDYTLRPPLNPDEAASIASDDAASTAQAALIGEGPPPAAKSSSSDAALLAKLGSAAADPAIRQKIDADNGYISLQNRSVADKLIFWSDEAAPVPEDAPASVIDPAAEASRLKKNKSAGKPLNEGKVPVIEKKNGTLGNIF